MVKEDALSLCRAVLTCFDTGKGQTVFKEYFPVREGDRKDSYLWSYFAATGMLYHACKAGLELRQEYRQAVEGLRYYRSGDLEGGMVKYHSERGISPDGGYGPCFFDDNIWVARNYLFAYEIFGGSEYLEEARRVAAYTCTGWNRELGGLVWNENGLTPQGNEQELERGLSANACCILVNALLYRITGREEYLEWSLRFREFCKTVQDPETGIYFNGVHTLLQDGRRMAGEINRDLWSYNSGSMILADIVLYEITGDAAYIEDAKWAAGAAASAFLCADSGTGMEYYRDFTWFFAIYVEGLHALKAYDRTAADTVFATLERSMVYAFRNYRSSFGLLPHDYITGWRKEASGELNHLTNPDYDRMLLTHSGTAEMACILSCRGEAQGE